MDKEFNWKRVDTEEQVDAVLAAIGADYVQCLYLYADIEIYRLKNPNMQIWYNEDGQGIRMVALKYHNSLQVYVGRALNDVEGLLPLINKEKPYSITTQEGVIRALEEKIPGYHVEYGVALKHRYPEIEKLEKQLKESEVKIEVATEEDVPEIARLICSDDELGASYTVSSLTSELTERIRTGMGRSFVIRDKGRIVAHTASYAESSVFFIGSGLIVDKEYRNTEYLQMLNSYIDYVFQKENKEGYGMVYDYNKRLLKAFQYMGFEIVAHYGRIYFQKEENCSSAQ